MMVLRTFLCTSRINIADSEIFKVNSFAGFGQIKKQGGDS